ncbi:MAG: hypothetical protein JWQ40_135 [Segetibacter sp.]|nr:hypothetical protein [Segetibacter sp.]
MPARLKKCTQVNSTSALYNIKSGPTESYIHIKDCEFPLSSNYLLS